MNPKKTLIQDVNLFKKVLDNAYDAICISDKDGRYIYVNTATAECMQLSLEEIIGKTPDDLVDQNAYTFSTINQAIESKQIVTGLVNVRGVNRLSTSIPILDENGEIDYVVTNNRSDIIIDEFSKQVAYEKERHQHFKDVANYLTNNGHQEIIFNSPKMAILLRNCKIVASADTSILINGESGAGKELIAKFIHNNSPRKNQAFIAVNCSTIPPELFESEFFGYSAGAFTGARNKGKAGLLQMANKGTLFLDELGELPLLMQAKLLRFTETGEFYPIGSNTPVKVDVRIITATNQNLVKMIKEGTFRSDLYYRLNVFPIDVPPLRERPEDIEVIANHFIEINNKKYRKEAYLSWQNLLFLRKYDWPGNVRELKNIIERAVLMAPDGKTELSVYSMLHPDDPELHKEDFTEEGTSLIDLPSLNLPLTAALEQFEQQYIKAVVEFNDGNVQKASKSLDIHRSTIYRKLKAVNKQ